jgi:hypothetical protein
VIEDEDAINPRVDCDNFGKMVCFHRRYNLGDEHHYPNKDEFLFDLLTDTMGSSDKAERFLCQVERKAEDVQHQYGGYGRAVDSMLLAEIAKKYVVLPLYLFDHSGITMNTTEFSCPWDSGQVGWIYASKEDVLKEYGGKLLTRGKRDKAEKLMRAEVSYYDSYLRGECYSTMRVAEGHQQKKKRRKTPMELTYRKEGDYLYPNLSPPPQSQPLGKYGLLRRAHLKENWPAMFSQMMAAGSLMEHLNEIDQSARLMMEQTMSLMLEQTPPPDKNSNPLGWMGHMNSLKHRAEEMALQQVVYSN